MISRFTGAAALIFASTLIAAPASAAAPTEEVCTRLFQRFDRDILMFSSPGQTEDLLLSRNAQGSAQRLMEVGCVTREADLAPLDALARELRGTLTGESGAPIERIWLHVGIVPGISSEVALRGFFADIGLRARGIGAPTLGRRIYVGPFVTEGGLAEAAAIARRAGFVAPYPRRFGT